MALSLAGFQTRISNELAKLDDFSSFQDELIKDALVDLMTYIRRSMRISATVAVTSATDTYDIPATIDIIEAIEDSDGDAVVYSVDKLEREFTLQDSEDSASAVNYTVYGTPLDIRTNASTVIAAIPESYGTALWAYIIAACHEQAESDRSTAKWNKAEVQAHKLLMYLNSEPGYSDRTIAIRDTQGQRVGSLSAYDGINYDITDLGATEGYDPT